MTKLSRYILIVTSILALAIFIPRLYWTAFEKPNNTPIAHYSCILDDFLLSNIGDDMYFDTQGNHFTREEYEEKLPLLYYRQLIVDKKMPDSIKGVAFDFHDFMKKRSFVRIQAKDINTSRTKIFPLLESQSGRAQLELPEDVFRINWRVDFINTTSNTIDETKSRLFSAALYHQGFEFPASFIAGIPSTRKSCDEGYLILDKQGKLFHLKMIKGQPYVKYIPRPNKLAIKYIKCVDFSDKLYYAYLISEDNEVYILNQDDYTLTQWPIHNYNPEIQDLKIVGDFFNYSIMLKSDSDLQCIALNKDYAIVDTFRYSWTPNSAKTVGKIADIIFPFTLHIKDQKSTYIKFYLKKSRSSLCLLVNLLLATIQIFIIIRRNHKIKKHLIDICIVLLFGVFGMISVNIFPNKFR